MDIVRSARDMQARAREFRRSGKRIGFVPTMGCLHEGHMSLVRVAREHADLVVVSIFVNPIQFLPGEDLAKYPRDFDRDGRACEDEGVAVVFHPAPEEMYAPDHSVLVDETALSRGLCGASRPGHFRGVATVVAKLFNLVLPDVAVFGQKDAQQARVVQRLVRDLNFPVSIVVAPIVREADGLAMSSRNVFLSAAERRDALGLRRSLDLAESLYRDGVRDADRIRAGMTRMLNALPGSAVDYVAIVDDQTLEPVGRIARPALVMVAVRVGGTRLIDNTVLGA
jgi:pantoate--beta-alanine ligase